MAEIPSHEQIVATSVDVVSERPDRVYANPYGMDLCFYVHAGDEGDECGCLVGHILHRVGVDLGTLSSFEHRPARTVATELGFALRTARFLETLQRNQDNGYTWDEALNEAVAQDW